MNRNPSLSLALLPLVVFVLAGCAGLPAESQGCVVAERYIDASNSGNAGLIAPYLDENVVAVFLAESGAAHSILEGRKAVTEAVRTYTAQCPSCRSSLRCLHETSNAAYVIEDVVFTDQDGMEQHQSAPLIFELDGRTIEAIVYFPSPDAVDSEAPADP